MNGFTVPRSLSANKLLFWLKVAITANPERCWLFLPGRARYGMVKWKGKNVGAHRVAYEIFYNRVPILDVLHGCDTPRCCNPHHLRQGTPMDNAKDRLERKRQPRGQEWHSSKLLEADVLEIRNQAKKGVPLKTIAVRYGLAAPTISRIVARKRWAHV